MVRVTLLVDFASCALVLTWEDEDIFISNYEGIVNLLCWLPNTLEFLVS
jgi:hypothetical protein